MTQLREVTGNEAAVARMWDPATVALVGASGRAGSLAWWPQHLIRQYGFGGRAIPVNPNRTEVDGVACVPSIDAIEGDIDVAVVTLDAAGTVRAVEECAERGVGAVVLPAQGFGESGAEGKRAERAMLRAARAAGMRIHGPNSDGIANFARGAVLSIQPVLGQQVRSGKVAVVTQSGATAASIVARLSAEDIGVRYYASAGNEIDLGFADYLSVALQDPEVSIVLAFIEAIRRPEDFVAVARLASELGKPIVAVKVGRTAQAAARAAAHTGALAGEDRIYQALFDSLGVIRVEELSELVAVAKLHLCVSRPGRTPLTDRIAIMSVSGGQAGALADRAVDHGLVLPDLSPTTAGRLDELIPHGSALNPCDLTGDVAKKPELASRVYEAFEADGGIGALVYARKALTGEMGRLSAAELAATADSSTLPLVVYSMDGAIEDTERAAYADARVAVFESAAEMCVALRRLATYAAREVGAPSTRPDPRFSIGAAARGVLDDVTAKSLLAAYGVEFVGEASAVDADGAVKLARELGYPVTMKVVSDRIPHKTEIGGVVLDVGSDDEVRASFDTLLARGRAALGGDEPDGVLVQHQVVDGVEIIVGLVTDAQFGPFVLVGTGGVTAELTEDVVLRPAPVSPAQALEMVRRLRGFPLLDGFRGAAPADLSALATLVSRLSELGHEQAGRLRELDVNPVLVRPDGHGAVAVDVLVIVEGAHGE